MKSSLADVFVQIKSMDIENGKAKVELLLPEWQGEEADTFVLYLWDEKDALVFRANRPVDEEEPCVIQLLHPHLWEGAEKPYLYRLELYGECSSGSVLLDCGWLALRTLKEISGKGWFLNERLFVPKCVRYASVGMFCDKGEQVFWAALEQRLHSLVKMGANTLVFDTLEGMSEQELIRFQECCDRKGLLVQTADQWTFSEEATVCPGGALFDRKGLPTDIYFRFKAKWSAEPFIYICAESLSRQTDGGYRVTVYSNRKKVALLVNGIVFGIQEDGPEFIYQDIQIKGFPVCLAAEAEACNMSVVCYGI